ncbi:MAG: hypothetical protein R3F60_17175 [bacterium]
MFAADAARALRELGDADDDLEAAEVTGQSWPLAGLAPDATAERTSPGRRVPTPARLVLPASWRAEETPSASPPEAPARR